jgi:hypothetical protein
MNVVKSSSVAVKLHPQLLFFFGFLVSEILKVLAILEVKVCQKEYYGPRFLVTLFILLFISYSEY